VFRVADLQALPAEEAVDVVFSTATFHWVLDHPRLFRHLFASLRPGGRLVAQCGGAGNLDRFHHRAEALLRAPRFSRFFEGWTDPWEFASAEVTAARLREAGFVEVETSLTPAPTTFDGAEAFRVFTERVVLRNHLARLPEELSAEFSATLAEQAARDTPAYTLDYVRLNMSAKRPGGES
jgi:trans-aconitate 2-methyltransferase